MRRRLPHSPQPLAASPAASQLRAALQDANEAVAAAKANGTVRSPRNAPVGPVPRGRSPLAHAPVPAGAQTPSRGEFSRLRHSMAELAAENTRLSLALAQAQSDAGRAKGGALVQAREEMRALADEQARSMADATALIAELTALLRKDLRAVEGPTAGLVDAGECWPAAAPSARRSGQRPAPGSVLGLAADLHGTVHKAACVRRAVRFAASAAAAQAQAATAAMPSPMATAGATATPPSSKRAKKFASPSPLQAQRVACSPLNMR